MHVTKTSKPIKASMVDVYKSLSGTPMKMSFIAFDSEVSDLDHASAYALESFSERVDRGERPMCLLCETVWTDFHCEPPAAVVLITTHEFFCDETSDQPAMVSAVCWPCMETGNAFARTNDVLRETFWPDLRPVAEPVMKPQ